MQQKSAIILATLAVLVFSAAAAQAQTFTTVYSFTGGSDGGRPETALIQDSSGNLFGTAYEGGGGNGVVFGVNTAGTETVLHSFGDRGSGDGVNPIAPLLRDSQGNLYGSTLAGGPDDGGGTVFKIDTADNETILYTFTGGMTDGCQPYQGVVMDRFSNLYGTTGFCGDSNFGTVFKVTPKRAETVLWSFGGGSTDGDWPFFGHLLIDKAGDLYGLTEYGGRSDEGVLYKLSKRGTLTLLHSFAGRSGDGCNPYGTLAMDKAGNFYGTTSGCGASGYGTVWKLSKTGKETILHSFAGGASDGCGPTAGVVLGPDNNLYGTTQGCGASNYGTVWELSAKGKLTLLHSFGDSDGAYPIGEVLRNAKGVLYGTASGGGINGCGFGCGTVWSYVPRAAVIAEQAVRTAPAQANLTRRGRRSAAPWVRQLCSERLRGTPACWKPIRSLSTRLANAYRQ